MKNKNLPSYILGILSVILFIPIFESLSELICSLLEIPKGNFTIKVMDINKKIQEKQIDQEPINTNCVGFEIPSEEYEYEEEDRLKNKIGF